MPTAVDMLRSDGDLVAQVAEILSVPRAEPSDSFVLHAPLELAARAALLPMVPSAHRERARLRFALLAERYERFSDPVPRPTITGFDSAETAASRFVAALDRGDFDDVDAAATWLSAAVSPADLRRLLADPIIDRLGAAAHAPIFLYQLTRVAVSPTLLRPLAHDLARHPEWRIRWIDEPRPVEGASPEALFEALRATPQLGSAGSLSIYPTMSFVDGNGVASDLLQAVTGGRDIAARASALQRASVLTMLQEPTDHAPYGWSHALTMPQAVLGIAGVCSDPSRALAVAATFLVGFRATIAACPLEAAYAPEDPGVDVSEALEADPDIAAAAAHNVPDHLLADLEVELATRAAVANDAHLVKYTLACLDAAAADPPARRLYLAGAAKLVAWWATHPDGDDPLAA